MSKNIKHYATALAVAFAFNGGAVWAQRASLSERVAVLEQQLGQGSEAQQTLADLVFRLNQMEAEIRELRGLVEDQNFEIENLRSSQRDQYLDLDRRLSEGRTAVPVQPDRFRRPDTVATTTFTDPVSQPDRGSLPVDQSTTTLPANVELPELRDPIDAQLETTGLGQQIDAAPVALADPVAEKRDYDQAFNALKGGRYSESSRLFAQFLERYPASEFSDNAQYWLAESYYATGNYRVALDAFQGLINNFPDSPKLPDARLKLGFTYVSLKDWPAAERTLQDVVATYPDSTVSRLAENRLRTMRIEGHIQ